MNRIIQVTDLPRDWTPPDGLGYSRMRPVRLTGAGIAVLVTAAAMAVGGIAGGIALGVQAGRRADERRLLRGQGALTEAQVTRLWRTRADRDEHTQTWVAYRFT